MKKITYILSIVMLTTLFSACDLLDLSPEDFNASENFWKNEAQVEAFALGVHSDLRNSYESMMFLLGEARGGTQKSGTSSQNTSLNNSSPIKDNTFTKDNTGIGSWLGLYNNIMQLNHFIDKLTNATEFLSADKRNYYLGQAYGLRAFYYFYLYRTFGGVPIVTDVKVLQGKIEAKNLYTPRSTAKQTMDFIKEDISKSETAFGTQNTIKNRKAQWSAYATQMLKAEVYLWSAKVTTADQAPTATDVQTAEAALNKVLANTAFDLMPTYKGVFEYGDNGANKGNKEVIFAIRYADGEASNFVSLFSYQPPIFVNVFYDKDGKLITTDFQNIVGAVQRHEYKWGLFASYDDKDTRKRSIFFDYYNKEGKPAGTVIFKYNGFINAQGNRSWSDDFVVYRYADALLMMAEVKNMQGASIKEYIDKIRKRAYGESFAAAAHGYTDADFATNEMAILKERDKEFVLEGKRWFDVRRMQQTKGGQPLAFSAAANYDDAMPIIDPSKPHLLLWPIDVNTLNNDPQLKQTEGYNE